MKAHDPSRSIKIAEFPVNLMLLLLLAGAVTILSPAVGLARHGNTLLGGRTFPIHAELPREQVGLLPRGVALTHDLPVTLEIKHASAAQLLLSTGIDLGGFMLLVGALWLLRGLIRSVRDGDPFGSANV